MPGTVTYPLLRAMPAPPLPVEKLILGKTVEEAADVLPRLFNLCRVAQGLAARAAFGLPLGADWEDELRQEILREHVVKLCLKWPALLSKPALPLPRDWKDGGAAMRAGLFGTSGRLPEDAAGFEVFLQGDDGIAALLRFLSEAFGPFEACRGAMPTASPFDLFEKSPADGIENSVAARQAHHPVMRQVEARWGRGPLWSATALAYDLQAVLDRHLPRARITQGRAVVPAARGLYGVSAVVEAGRVRKFRRITPTDHLLAPRGALAQSLDSLPGPKAAAFAPVVMAILDPCYPVRLEQAQKRERAYA